MRTANCQLQSTPRDWLFRGVSRIYPLSIGDGAACSVQNGSIIKATSFLRKVYQEKTFPVLCAHLSDVRHVFGLKNEPNSCQTLSCFQADKWEAGI